MTDKPKVKFLTVIWGKRYIEEYARVSLPSLLAPGNLPALAEACDLEILVMTAATSVAAFHHQPAFKTLQSLCPVRFILIDDLITTGNYGVTLTLAFARGIEDSGSEQLNTHFVFMNSDFVLADGSLRALAGRIAEGAPCIMAPSLRACSEAVLPLLEKSVDPDANCLAMPPREMVRLALENLHPTAIAKTITQDFVNCWTHNQIYWQVDSATLLGRYHLIFMLAIRPERPMRPVNSYCDYGFVPELVPSGRFAIMDDSDDFFMLEIQSAQQEKHFLSCGSPSIDEIAQELSVWTTAEHRRFAEHDVVFHSGDLPPNLEAVREQAAAFVSELHRKMRPPVSHVDHFYWVLGVQAWASLKQAEEIAAAGVSTTPDPASTPWLTRVYLDLLRYMRRRTGVRPNVPIWHHAWLDSRLLLKWLASVNDGGEHRNLLACGEHSPLAASLGKLAPFDVIRLPELMSDEQLAGWREAKSGGRPYDRALLHVYRAQVKETRAMLERLLPLLARDAVVGIYIDHEGGESDPSNFSNELAHYVENVLPAGWTGFEVKASFAGGKLKRRLRRIEIRLLRHLLPGPWKHVPIRLLVFVLWPGVAALTALNNWRWKDREHACPPYCSSALLRLSRSGALSPTVAGQGLISVSEQLLPGGT